jgi:ATP-dependent exoDNAse (exonuclease V) beta subunit
VENNFVVYKSSAGAGKTFTLVKEYLSLCVATTQEDYYRRILAITFTNKAAGEMRERVLSVLNAWSNNTIENKSAFDMLNLVANQLQLTPVIIQMRAAKVYTHILHHYSDVSIKTIDKFTTQVIRTFASDLGMPAHFQLTVDTQEPLQYAVRELLSKAGEDSVLSNVILNYVMHQLDNDKDYKLHEVLYNAGKLVFDEKHFDKLKATQNTSLTDYLAQQKLLNQELNNITKATQLLAQGIVNVVTKQGLTVDDFAYGKDGAIGQIFKLINDKFNINSYDIITKARVINAIENNAWYSKSKAKEVSASIDSIAAELNTKLRDLRDVMQQEQGRFTLIKLLLDNFYAFILLTEIDKLVQQYKEENNTALLAEFNATIAQVVAQEPAPFIYERLGERYNHFLIDEFQDTSTMQFINLLPLLDNSLAQGFRNLIVGDAKQSIYRFRGGEAALISNLPNIKNDNNNVLIDEYKNTLARNFNNNILNGNYRSKREVIEFNNYFFETAKQHITPLVATYYEAHNQEYSANNTGGYVHVKLLTYKVIEEYNEQCCQYVLDTIAQCINDGYTYADVALLVRGNSDGAMIAEHLKANNINVLSDDALWLGKNTTIKFIINICALVTNPQDYHAAHAIVTYLYQNNNINTEQNIQAMHRLRNFETPASVINASYPNVNFNKLQALSLYDAVQYIVVEFKLTEREPNYVLSFLNNVWARTIDGKDSWKDYMEHWHGKGFKQSVNQSKTGNAVRVLTIHKSKGLEFPVVILPKISGDYKFKRNEVIDVAMLNVNVPMGLITVDKKLASTDVNYLYEQEAVSLQADELNTLYVAFTRPVHRLYALSGSKLETENTALEHLCETIPNIIKNVINASANYDATAGEFTMGTLQAYNAPKVHIHTQELVVNSNEKIWFNELSIGKKHTLTEQPTTELDKKTYGIFLHAILAQMHGIEALPTIVLQLQLNGELSATSAQLLINDVEALWLSNHINEWKNAPINVINEQNILTNAGEVIRPDKVIECASSIWVYDFKTGEQNTAHAQQIITYVDALKQLYNKPVHGKIIYLSHNNVSTVQVV